MDKKYYQISEVMQILRIPAYQLRYLDKILPQLEVAKMKGRRYYTEQNINFLKAYLNSANLNKPTILSNLPKENSLTTILQQVEDLIVKFKNLSSNLVEFL